MSLCCPVGSDGYLFEVSPHHAGRMTDEHPILTLNAMQALKDTSYKYVH